LVEKDGGHVVIVVLARVYQGGVNQICMEPVGAHQGCSFHEVGTCTNHVQNVKGLGHQGEYLQFIEEEDLL
jgi:hypothetical protein